MSASVLINILFFLVALVVGVCIIVSDLKNSR